MPTPFAVPIAEPGAPTVSELQSVQAIVAASADASVAPSASEAGAKKLNASDSPQGNNLYLH
jgi:hypothetical protein